MQAIMVDKRARGEVEKSVRRLLWKAEARGACRNDSSGHRNRSNTNDHCKNDINISVSNSTGNNSDNYTEFVRF